MEQIYSSKEMCSGCKACVEVCPVKAIFMCKDDEGFEYPQIDKEKCINCGKCKRLCSFKRENIKHTKLPRTIIGAKIKDEKERTTSRSGGFFIAIANYILSQNGVVYGCKFGKDLEVHHERATTKQEVDEFKGSKYVKSNLKEVYKQVKLDLEQGKKVLFSGTPCEIAGLKVVLAETDISKLYLCDIICHGVPSPLIYEEYIKFFENREGERLKSIDFRDKSLGWSNHKETLIFENKKITTSCYTELFYSHHILRPSCYNCQFCNMDRVSDITMGDFWGIEKENKEFYDEIGTSLVLVNTVKGQQLLEYVMENLHWIPVYSKHYMQHNLRYTSGKPENRSQFWEDYEQNGFEYIIKKYAGFEGDEN